MKTQLSIITIILMLILSCNINDSSQHNKLLKQIIESKIQEDGPCLSQMEALYNLAFAHYHKNMIFSDDIYYRRDLATVYYGYPLNELKIEVIEENDENILKVFLPNPKEITTDKKIKELNCTNKKYKPTDENDALINIDKIFNDKLDQLKNKYKEKSLSTTKELSQKYFHALGKRFGLKVKITYL